MLSAKHHLLPLEKEIEPYNLTLNEMSPSEMKAWAEEVYRLLKEQSNLQQDKFIFLAGKTYREYLTQYLSHYKVPMEGLGIGKQLQWLDQHTKS